MNESNSRISWDLFIHTILVSKELSYNISRLQIHGIWNNYFRNPGIWNRKVSQVSEKCPKFQKCVTVSVKCPSRFLDVIKPGLPVGLTDTLFCFCFLNGPKNGCNNCYVKNPTFSFPEIWTSHFWFPGNRNMQ